VKSDIRRLQELRPPSLHHRITRLSRQRLTAISQFRFAAFPRTIGAAENPATARLDPVADNLAAAMLACRCDHLNGAFETVENVGFAASSNLESFIVVVTAKLTFRHILASRRLALPRVPKIMGRDKLVPPGFRL
jgi:hypothetical protein